MKTTKFLSVLGLASLMAACSSEEFEAPQQAVDNLALRPIIEAGLNFDNGVATKMAIEGTNYYPTFVENDVLGAAVVDAPLYTSQEDYKTRLEAANGDVTALYEFTNHISSNYPYTYAAGKWTTPAELVEGNYLFYAPYSKKNLKKAPIMIVTPAVQDATTEKKALEQLATSTETPAVLGAQFLAATGSMNPNVQMFDVFSYPMFTIVNNFDGYLLEAGKFTPYKGAVKVKSVQFIKAQAKLNGADANFVVAEAIDNKKAATAVPEWNKTTFSADEKESGTWTIAPDAASADVVKAKNGVIATMTLNNEIAAGKSYAFYAVLPAAAYKTELCALVNIEVNGKEYVIKAGTINANRNAAKVDGFAPKALAYTHNFVIKEAITEESGVTLLRGQRYPREMMNFNPADMSFAGLKKNPESLLTIDLFGGTIAKKGENVQGQVAVIKEEAAETRYVEDNAGLLALCDKQNNLALAEVASVNDIKTINDFVIAENNTITVNAELIEGLASKLNKGSLNVSSVLAIDAKEVFVKEVTGSADATVITFGINGTKIVYPITMKTESLNSTITKSGTYVNSATTSVIALPKNTKTETYKVNIINAASQQLTITATENFESLLSVNNLGTLTLSTELDNTALGIYNAGTLTINNNTNAFIYNAGTATVAANKGIFTGARNEGTITPEAGATVTIASGAGEVVNDAFATVANSSAEQTVSYTVNAAFDKVIENTNKFTGINTVKFANTVTADKLEVLLNPIKNVTTVSSYVFNKDVTTAFEANKSLAGKVIIVADDLTWNGVNKNITKFNDATVFVAKDKTLSLNNITVNGKNIGKGAVKANMSAATDMK